MSNLIGRDYREKRNYIRMRVDAPAKITLATKTATLAGICRDLSGGGVLIELAETLPVGTIAQILITSEYGHSPMLKARAEVKRVISQPEHNAQPCLLGMEILEVLN